MRRLFKFISVAGLALALAASANAGALVGGTLSFALGTLTPLTGTGVGPGSSAGPPGSAVTLGSPTAFATVLALGASKITLAPTAAAPLSALSASVVAPTGCSFTGAVVGATCALGGTVNALVGGAPFLIVPLAGGPATGAGLGGRLAFGPYGSYIDFIAGWSAGAVGVTINGVQLTTGNVTTPGVGISTFGYDNRNALGAGKVKLVAPGGLMSTLGGPFPLFISMTLTFVPEPGTLLLLGSGIVGLGLLGRKKQKNA